ncbi:MAG: FtsX-like permease family protein [Dehalococcoidia bacterium]
MEKLFGVPMTGLAGGLAAALVVAVLVIVVMALRNRILLKLALRNIPRRRAQTVLIVVGLMLSTTIIASSLAIGDTVTYSIRSAVLDALGHTDQRVRSPQALLGGIVGGPEVADFATAFGDTYLGEDQIAAVLAFADGDDRIDGVLPQIRETLPVLDTRSQLTESRMVVAGFDTTRLEGFGAIKTIGGATIRLGDLEADEVLLNEPAAEELEAKAGDEVVIVAPDGRHSLTVRAIVREGGLAATDKRALMPLATMQRIMDRPGLVNRIDISNLGGVSTGVDLSEDVTRDLRVAFTDPEIAAELFDLLAAPGVISALERYAAGELPGGELSGGVRDDLNELVRELRGGTVTGEFRSLVADPEVAINTVVALETGGHSSLVRPATILFAGVVQLSVDPLKEDALELAEFIGNIFVTIFSIFGSFSIIVGLLLIFLVFVMLAASRSAEMGIARAVGTKRRHLVQMFSFEGAAYAVGAALAGTVLGLIASRILVALLAQALIGDDDGFSFRYSFTATSAIAAFSVGMLLTLITVAISAYRVSRLNIVVAIRGLPQEFVASDTPRLRRRLLGLGLAILGPFSWLYRLYGAVIAPTRLRRPATRLLTFALVLVLQLVLIIPWLLWILFRLIVGLGLPEGALFWTLAYLAHLLLLPVVWPVRILLAIYRLVDPYLRLGWPVVILGLLMAWAGIALSTASLFAMGASLLLVGVALLVRVFLRRSGLRDAVTDRISYTFLGGSLLVFWALPFSALNWLTGELSGSMEMFILSGVWMVAAAVWLVMYNADVVTRGLTTTLGRVRAIRPIITVAVAYPMAARFRTGLTVAMFALVIFTMMVLAILMNLGSGVMDETDRLTGGFEIRASVSPDLPVEDMAGAIAEADGLDAADFEVIAASRLMQGEGRQTGADEQRFKSLRVRGTDETFLRTTRFEFSHYDPTYLPAGTPDDDAARARAIWDALAEDPTLAVLNHASVLSDSGFGGGGFGDIGFQVEGLKTDDDPEISEMLVRVRQPLGRGGLTTRKVIAVMDALAGTSDPSSFQPALVTRADVFDELSGSPVPLTDHSFRLTPGADAGRIGAALETAFLDHGMAAVVEEEALRDMQAQNSAFNRLFQGFLGLGLIVGVASLGVLSFRAVIERRHSIGMMRALGYRARMIQIQFLLESAFITLLGVGLGMGLGALISWNIVNEIADEVEGLEFTIPWMTVTVIVVITVAASLLMAYLPARQAARIYPSDALRYE